VTGLALVCTVGVGRLPAIFGDPATGMFSGSGQIPAWTLLGIDVTALLAIVRLPDRTPERLWLSVAMVAACFDVWLTFHAGARYSVGWYLGKVGSLTTTMVVLVSLVNDLAAIYRRVRIANTALADLANRDGLTGIANRRNFDATLSTEMRRTARHGKSTALLMIDVDHFKRYNDLLGHQQGDDCLRQVASVAARNARRPGDLAARYGGEEFALILPFTDLAGALRVGERLLHDMHALALAHPGAASGRVTISIGVAASATTDPQELVRRTDAALYRAKRTGRDRLACDGAALPERSAIGVDAPAHSAQPAETSLDAR
jgi:diguanylate cyclase (GGDEF)-like protein